MVQTTSGLMAPFHMETLHLKSGNDRGIIIKYHSVLTLLFNIGQEKYNILAPN